VVVVVVVAAAAAIVAAVADSIPVWVGMPAVSLELVAC
jgi:hypothetical protein